MIDRKIDINFALFLSLGCVCVCEKERKIKHIQKNKTYIEK